MGYCERGGGQHHPSVAGTLTCISCVLPTFPSCSRATFAFFNLKVAENIIDDEEDEDGDGDDAADDDLE